MGGRRRISLVALVLAAITLAVTWHVPTVPRIAVTTPDGLLGTARATRAGFGTFTVAVTVGNLGATERAGRIECIARNRWGLELGRGTSDFGPVAPRATAIASVTVTGTSGRSARTVDCTVS